MKSPRNVPASVRQRLLNRARSDKRPFSELLQYYAMERFLYRLSQSPHANRFILKGALLLKTWSIAESRPTMDIDMLGQTSNDDADIVAQIRDILAVDVEADGLTFDPDSILTERITEEKVYSGIRTRFTGSLDSARISMQIDIGFDDVVYPGPEASVFPTILDFPAPKLLCYSPESAIAEKFETMIKLGVLNSRMKDFYDIWFLSNQLDFDGAKLAEAIRQTFERRGTIVPEEVEAFSEGFIEVKQVQWTAFRNKLNQDHVPTSFKDIVSGVENFLAPLASALSTDNPKPSSWSPTGPWS